MCGRGGGVSVFLFCILVQSGWEDGVNVSNRTLLARTRQGCGARIAAPRFAVGAIPCRMPSANQSHRQHTTDKGRKKKEQNGGITTGASDGPDVIKFGSVSQIHGQN